MKNLNKTIVLLLFIVGFSFSGFCGNPPEKEKPIEEIIENLLQQMKKITLEHQKSNLLVQNEIAFITKRLAVSQNLKEQVKLLVRKDQLETQLRKNRNSELSDISRIRYLKGLEIIKVLYGKTLALDHHFASISTFHEISKIANPNHYPDFVRLKDNLQVKADKKSGFQLGSLMNNNIYTSVIYSFVSLFSNNNLSKQEKEASLKEVECILDFTLRMHNDLNTIYFETSFLQESNENLMKDLDELFKNYTEPIGYTTSLQECRQNDEWDAVRKKLDEYVKEMDVALQDDTQTEKARTMRIDLEFPVDRLLRFIEQYNGFIDKGTEFYEKFKIMLSSYENEQQCSTKIPIAYKNLKENIDVAIEKFNTAYRPVEINGSKMKQLLYGINIYQ